MSTCKSCYGNLPEGSRFCPACGATVGASSEVPTHPSPDSSPPTTPIAAGSSARSHSLRTSPTFSGLSSSPGSGGEFVPGAVLAERYRIIGLLGRGGMGEVYRADDLKLGQPVALKFLPASIADNEDRLERFFSEVRTARQVTHANVCRVHDLGEIEGRHFLSMEYVDGEDLASLLRRVGRLPKERAIPMARQLCAGLAAAHDQGILHRDLKPANVMIDGRGRVRITDFGLAALAGEIAGSEVRAGTPAYMAPEQLAGKEVTARSDLYSLGLVLYELFTGKTAFDAPTPEELRRLQTETTPTSPSSVVDNFDPAVERVILRCLERDPRERPGSALAVAAALPGADPLAAALAAGETPSPEMVADAGDVGGLQPGIGLACLLGIVAAIVVIVALADGMHLLGRVGPIKPPEALADDAREIARRLGYEEAPADNVHGYEYYQAILTHVQQTDASLDRWERLGTLRPSPVSFWYRQSPRPLVPNNNLGAVIYDDPRPQVSGEVKMLLDPAGRLFNLLAIPPQLDAEPPLDGADLSSGWQTLFDAAGLDRSLFTEAAPEWNPLVNCSERAAWEGTYTGQADLPIRVEACAYRERPVYFEIIHPWDVPTRMQQAQTLPGAGFLVAVGVTLFVLVIGVGLFLAWRNTRAGRGDRRGAFRVAAFTFAANFLAGLFLINHVPALNEVALLLILAAQGLLTGCLMWVIYIAIEPYVRRLWPDAMISWSRLLAGRYNDPRIGRDLLIAGLTATAASLANQVESYSLEWLSLPLPAPFQPALFLLDGLGSSLGLWSAILINAVAFPMIAFLIIMVLRILLRRVWAAVTVAVLFLSVIVVIQGLQTAQGWEGSRAMLGGILICYSALIWIPYFVILTRLGLLAGMFYSFFWILHLNYPLTTDFSAFYAGRALVMPVLACGLALYGFWIARAGRPLMEKDLLGE